METENPLRLGDILLRNGWVTEQNLHKALQYQQDHGGLLGNILTDFGWAEEPKVKKASRLVPKKGRIGEMLVRQGVLQEAQLNRALEFQQKSGGAIGDILLSLEMVDAPTLYRAVASQQEMGRIGAQFNIESSARLPEDVARKFQAVVVHTSSHRAVVAVARPLAPDQAARLESLLGHKIEQVLATHAELQHLWHLAYTDKMLEISTEKLALDRPDQSAAVVFHARQKAVIAAVLVLFMISISVDWLLTILVVNVVIQSLYFVVAVLKFYIIMKGTRKDAQIVITDEEVAAVDERSLPVYTILTPLYKESDVIPQLVANLERLDYPKHKLDIRLLVEEDDLEARQLLSSMALPPYYTTLVVPDSKPKTKPKACNYGLINARGEYVVIFDAEDRPDPDQLKKAYLAFQRSPDTCCCIQAKLNYYNSEQNLLTRWFTQEYSMWFDLLLPGLMQMRVPIPLGGTSNHFKTRELRALNAWDPHNVTEDADLGIRLYVEGYTTGIVNSWTWEEASSRAGSWIRQRSRWIKGYMQTWLVHMRFPLRLWRHIGSRGMLGVQVIVLATPLLPLVNPFLWLMLILWFAGRYPFIPLLFPGPIYFMAAVELLLGNFLFVFSNVIGIYWIVGQLYEKGDYTFSYSLVKYALLTPLYWILMSVAAYKAAGQLLTKPFYWEKTAHGLAGATGQGWKTNA